MTNLCYSQVALKDRLVSEWKEKSKCKVFYGVHRVDNMSDNKKVFNLKKTASSGTFGMYVAVKNTDAVSTFTHFILQKISNLIKFSYSVRSMLPMPCTTTQRSFRARMDYSGKKMSTS